MASPSEVAAEAATQVLALARSRPPTLGDGRLICVDGRAGSGKTTLAAVIAALDVRAHVVHMDDLYDGWDGLPRVGAQLETLLRPLASGRTGSYRRYDWYAAGFAETVTVEPGPLLVVEGVGSGLASYDDLRTVLAWVTAPAGLRRERWREREGSESWWDTWRQAEERHFAADGTMARADLVVDGGEPRD